MITVQDHIDIVSLYATYNHLADGEDAVEYSNCYTAEGILITGGRVLGNNRAEIAQFRKASMQAVRAQGMKRRHISTDIVLEPLSAVAVRGRCYLQSCLVQADKVHLTHSCTTDDSIVKEQGRWRFARRVLTLDFGNMGPG